MLDYWPHISLAALLNVAVIAVFIPWVLLTKKDPTAAVAWCLAVLFVPLGGALLFWLFGYNYLHRRLRKKRRHGWRFRREHPPPRREAARGAAGDGAPEGGELGRLAQQAGAFPATAGNAVILYHDTEKAFAALLEAVAAARHHVHLEYFIVHADVAGHRLLDLLTRKAREGVEVRLLFDAMGSLHLPRRALRPLAEAGGRAVAFLPLNPLRSLFHVNLRNHRKITVIDGRAGFTGGMNVGDEYLGRSSYFGYWRDAFLKVEGPAVAGLQRVFTEDWNFAGGDALTGPAYFPDLAPAGDDVVQVADSGPEQENNCIREVYFLAILSARERLWMASPYFVPDRGLLDALRAARYRGVDVRLLGLWRPDHYVSFFASRYYWAELLEMGVRVYQYRKGMMHAKLMLVDGRWAMVGSANLDNRSLHLNFEVGCALHSPRLVADLEAAYLRDLEESVPVGAEELAARSLPARVVEHACRLFTPLV